MELIFLWFGDFFIIVFVVVVLQCPTLRAIWMQGCPTLPQGNAWYPSAPKAESSDTKPAELDFQSYQKSYLKMQNQAALL